MEFLAFTQHIAMLRCGYTIVIQVCYHYYALFTNFAECTNLRKHANCMLGLYKTTIGLVFGKWFKDSLTNHTEKPQQSYRRHIRL